MRSLRRTKPKPLVPVPQVKHDAWEISDDPTKRAVRLANERTPDMLERLSEEFDDAPLGYKLSIFKEFKDFCMTPERVAKALGLDKTSGQTNTQVNFFLGDKTLEEFRALSHDEQDAQFLRGLRGEVLEVEADA